MAGADAGNYTVNSNALTTANIRRIALLGGITAANKTYDGSAIATITSRTLTGVLPGEVVTYIGGIAMFSSKYVGVGKTVTATGLSLGGTDFLNYTVNATATTSADIDVVGITNGIIVAKSHK